MKIQLWSKTMAGKWAAILTLLFIVLMALKFLTLGISLRIPLPTPFIAGLGVIGFIMGIVSIVKNKELEWGLHCIAHNMRKMAVIIAG